ncbi:hypothetical protein CBM2608_A50140 [Cupriavidus taiwanensis]|nr:hypothetical protein CBM2608_A50140 [Cupriavidus taiwanensis]
MPSWSPVWLRVSGGCRTRQAGPAARPAGRAIVLGTPVARVVMGYHAGLPRRLHAAATAF